MASKLAIRMQKLVAKEREKTKKAQAAADFYKQAAEQLLKENRELRGEPTEEESAENKAPEQ